MELVKFYEKNEDGSDILKRKFESYLASGREEERAAPPDSDSGTFVSSLAQCCIAPLQWCGFTKGSQVRACFALHLPLSCHSSSCHLVRATCQYMKLSSCILSRACFIRFPAAVYSSLTFHASMRPPYSSSS